MSKKKEVSVVRSSAAEYLTFVAAGGNSEASVEMRYADENIWLTQKMMATLYDVSVSAVNQHLKRIFADNELEPGATVKKYLIVQTEGGREVRREVEHYNLQAIISVGFKIENERAVQFRKWANQIVKDYTIQGWTMDVERLKHGGSILTDEYFERQLEKIREIRLSERKFYQKVTDIYSTSLDYDRSATATKRFFAAVQNKMHYSIHGQTAAEVIVERADHQKENMGLTSWEGAPQGKIHKYDVSIAKNYLTGFELEQMQRIVSAYLDMAELHAMRRIPMTMADWEERLGGFLKLWDREILQDAGKVSAEIAKAHAESEFEKYRIVQDRLFESDFDKVVKWIEDSQKKESTLASRKSRDISVKEMIEHRGDIHHIFPRQYLKENGFSQSQYNQVANYVYVQQEINIKEGKRSPADYIGQIREQCQSGKLAFGGIDTLPDFEANLEANCIPGNIYEMTLEDYDEFLGARRILMARKIKCFYQNL